MKMTKTNATAKVTPRNHDGDVNNNTKQKVTNNGEGKQTEIAEKPEPTATQGAHETSNYTLGQLIAGNSDMTTTTSTTPSSR